MARDKDREWRGHDAIFGDTLDQFVKTALGFLGGRWQAWASEGAGHQ